MVTLLVIALPILWAGSVLMVLALCRLAAQGDAALELFAQAHRR